MDLEEKNPWPPEESGSVKARILWPLSVLVLMAIPFVYLTGAFGLFRNVDMTVGCSQVCEVHREQMVRLHVPIQYGLYQGILGEAAVWKTRYPHAATEARGGCVVTPTSPLYAYILTCRSCQDARKRWSSEHAPTPY